MHVWMARVNKETGLGLLGGMVVTKYIIKRIGYMVVVLFIVTTITFFLVHMIPGNPLLALVQDMPEASIDTYMAKYGYDQPLYIQYFKFLKELFSGNLGESVRYPGRQVWGIVVQYAPVSAQIAGIGLLFGFLLGIILGIVAALNRSKAIDKVITVVALLGTTIPAFVIASLLQYIFSVKLKVLPPTGWKGLQYAIMPVICMFVSPLATYARYMRSSLLDVSNQDYILVAQAKGASSFRIVTRHMLKNAFLPCITLLGTSVANIFSGSFIVETIFSIPGVGKYFISAINDRDYSMVLGLNIVFTGIYIISVLITDILLVILDPRIRLKADSGKVRHKRKKSKDVSIAEMSYEEAKEQSLEKESRQFPEDGKEQRFAETKKVGRPEEETSAEGVGLNAERRQ